jgi:hypothetical protein
MATHIVKNSPRPWGKVIASNVGNVLSHLAEAKAHKMYEDHDVRLLSSLGIDPIHARFINSLPAQQKSEAVGNYLNAAAQQKQQQQEPISETLSPNQQQFMPQQQQVFQQRSPFGEAPRLSEVLGNQPNASIAPDVLKSVLSSPQKQQQQRQVAAQEQQLIAQQAHQQREPELPHLPAPQEQAKAPVKGSLLGAALTGGKTAAQELALRKEERAERTEQFNKEKEVEKKEAKENAATQKYYEEVISADKAAKESDDDLKKMKHLIQKGKLPPAQMYKYLKDAEESLSESGGIVKTVGAGAALGFAAGGPVGAALGAVGGLAVSPVATMLRYGQKNNYPDIEEFEKLTNGFIRYAKGIFGSRITDADLKAFLATVPTLANTDQGKKAIINNMELFNQGVHEKYKVMREIIKEHGGKRPLDLALQVQDRLDTRLSSLANKWESSAEASESSALLKSV